MKKEVAKQDARVVRVGSSNFLSQIFFFWVFWFIFLIKKAKDLKDVHLILRRTETTSFNDQILEKHWKEEVALSVKQNRLPLIRRAIFKAYGSLFLLNGVWKIVWGISLWFGAYWLLKKTVAYSRTVSKDPVEGQMYALGFLVSSIMASIAIHQLLSKSGCLGLRVKSALMVQIFKKSLVLARIKGGAGDIVNLVSNDCQKIADAFTNLHYLWSATLEVIAILTFSFIELKYSAIPALVVILLLTPIQLYLGKFKSKIGFENTMITSKRVHMMSEILSAIKLIKFYAWESPFYDRVCEIRDKELSLLKKNLIANAINFMLVFCAPVLVALFALLTYSLSKNTIDPIIGFTVISVFNTLRYPLLMAPLAINSASDAATAIKRLDEFFSRDEIQPSIRYPNPKDSEDTIILKNATFKWEIRNESSQFILKNINIKIKRGTITAVVGNVGCGKSSLLAAILGQMKQINGECKVLGSIGYVPQEAWLLNMTLKENIIFGSPYDNETFRNVVKLCALEHDIKLMKDGDRTEIGERGINLSGGQRQRISLARCVYKSSDIILLDDPLSAVDQHVGKYIFTNCLKEHLKDKTLLFVTHQLQYLHLVDHILVMNDGMIIEHGSFDELMSLNGHLAKLVGSHVQIIKSVKSNQKLNDETINNEIRKDSIELIIQDTTPATPPTPTPPTTTTTSPAFDSNKSFNQNDLATDMDKNIRKTKSLGQLLQNKNGKIYPNTSEIFNKVEIPTNAEPMKLVLEDQSINYKTLPIIAYLNAGYGVVVTLFIFLFFFLVHLIRILSDYWLSLWFAKSSGSYKNISDAVFIGVYGGSVGLFVIGVLLRGVAFSNSSIRKSKELHEKMFKTIIYARMSFFEATPIGRILNAFARHQYAFDAQLADSLIQLLQYLPLCLGAMILIMSVMYQSIGIFGGAVIISIGIFWFFRGVESKLRNQEAITKSLIFSHLTATLEGLFSIRAYNCQQRFIEFYRDKIDENHKYLFAMMEVKCWMGFYFDILTSFIIYFTVIVVIRLSNVYPASTSGLVLSNVLQLLVFLQWTIRMFGDVRERLSSVKQISYYGNSIEPEALPIIATNRPPKDWPQNGNIKFSNVFLKFQTKGVDVLKGITINIKSKEKIGIVGRTGSGKSTLLISLLRIVEMSNGQITIDDIDVSKIGLLDLRTKIAIIPQEPILFVGTIRENVDLFNKNTDEEVWRALDAVNLGEYIRKYEQKLNSPVIENGKNFSVGQRQLFCIARAILSKTKILVLDEATAAVDLQTDNLIQQTLRDNFKDLTVLTIAHRLNTIMESDKILVMDAGKVVEFAPPLTLLKIPDGHFTSLLRETGKESYQKLYKIAEERALKNLKQDDNDQSIDPLKDPDNIIIDKTTGLDIIPKDSSKNNEDKIFILNETKNISKL